MNPSQSFCNSNPKFNSSSLVANALTTALESSAPKELLLNFGLELKKLSDEFYWPTERISE